MPPDARAALEAWRARVASNRASGGASEGAPSGSRSGASTVGAGPVVVARAPGRLDLLGGIADYSGSEVLQRPIAEAAVAIARRTGDGAFAATSERDGLLERVILPTSLFAPGGPCATPALARAFFARGAAPDGTPLPDWAGHVAGTLVLLVHEAGLRPDGGVRLALRSDVPEGLGVSSSAAIEVACAGALARLHGLDVDGAALARLCQRAENEVVGAPCGLMDQMTSVLGRSDALFALHCVPDRVLEPVPMADGFAAWGIDSGVRHAVGGADYGSVRVGAFMGYRLLLDAAGVADASVPASEVVDERWGGYLANATPSELDGPLGDALPERMTGAAFLERFDGITDAVTRVDPAREYAVRAPTRHPVLERQRVRAFRQLMAALAREGDERARDDVATTMGEHLYGSHAGYGACGIGSAATDALVAAVRTAGPEAGLYGARISGGGSGGTVAVFGHADADAEVRRIAVAHRARTGAGGHVFAGGSDGLATWILD